jgi:hypothetical protein
VLRAGSVVVVAAVVIGLWGFSMFDPHTFGSCTTVALHFGNRAAAVDCQPYGAADFVVPLGVLVLVGLIFGKNGFEWDSPFGKITVKGNEAGARLESATGKLDERGESLIDSL